MTDSKLPYGPEDRISPSPSDDDLWKTIQAILTAQYPDRIMLEHLRWAFDAVCAETGESMLFKDFLRKVRLKWLWKRPPLPRGLAGDYFD